MMNNIIEVILKHIREIDGIKCFYGNYNSEEACKVTIMLAEECAFYRVDEEEEIYLEDQRSCYNCRFRKWTHLGFNCLKEFPVSKIYTQEKQGGNRM